MAINKIEKIGYGQIEPNRLTAQKTKEIYAQLPAEAALNIIENGMALIYDEVAKQVKKPTTIGAGRVCLVMNEIILEDERSQEESDYAQFNREETKYQVAIKAYPRLYGLHVGDTFTTNTVKVDDTYKVTKVPDGTMFCVDVDGYWTQTADKNSQVLASVVKDYTLDDGQRALKLTIVKVANEKATTI